MPVRTDPESLRQVAVAIQTASDQIDQALQRMKSSLAGATWQDPVRNRFDQDFNNLVRSLDQFKTQAQPAVQHLKRKAAQLDAYAQN